MIETEQTETPQIQTSSTATPTLNEQQQRLIHRLTEAGINTNRFLKVGDEKLHYTNKHPEGEYLDKAAFETDFQNNLYGPEDLGIYPRWGIIGKDGLTLLDFDKQEIYDILDKRLPDTLEATSPRHGLPHRYYKVIGGQVANNRFHIPEDVDERGLKNSSGEIRSNNHYLVAPGTTIRYQDLTTGEWKTGEYTITNDIPIATLTYAEFMAAVEPYLLDRTGEKRLTDEMLTSGVSVGVRHDTIFRYACRLMGDNPEGGYPATITLDILRRYNQNLVNPSVEDEYLVRVIKQACEYAAKESGAPVEQIAQLGFKEIHKQQSGQDQSLLEQLQQIENEIKQARTPTEHISTKQGIILKICPKCGYPVNQTKKDASGKQWWICGRGTCNSETNEPTERIFNDYMIEGISSYSEGEEGREKFNPGLFARELMNHAFFKTDKNTDVTYIYNPKKGIWEDTAIPDIKTVMAETLKENLREHHYKNVIFNIKANTYENLNDDINKIAVKNGILNLKTLEMEEKTPGNFILAQIPVTYDPKADCPAITKFLLEVFGDNWIPTVQEYIGYCLYREMPFHKLIILIGDGSNGKSKFLSLIATFLGLNNCSSIPLQLLCEDKFTIAQLYGKMANICADLSSNEISKLGPVKLLTGDDRVYAQHKFGKGFDFTNKAKMLYSANKPPQIKEDTDAVFRRLIVIPCNAKFEGANCDPDILAKLTTPTELSGLLNIAIDALKRLLEQKGFTYDNGADAVRTNYLRQSDSAKAFIEEKLESINDPNTMIPDLHEQFVLWCNTEKLATVPKRTLTEKMQEYMPQTKQAQRRISGKQTWVWVNLRVKEPIIQETKGQSTLPVTTVTTVILKEKKEELKEEVVEHPVTVVTPESSNNRVCGDCGRFHLPSCGYIGNNFQTLPADKWAGELRCWIPKQPETAEFPEEAPTIEA